MSHHSAVYAPTGDRLSGDRETAHYYLVPVGDITDAELRRAIEAFKLNSYSSRPTSFNTEPVAIGNVVRHVSAHALLMVSNRIEHDSGIRLELIAADDD